MFEDNLSSLFEQHECEPRDEVTGQDQNKSKGYTYKVPQQEISKLESPPKSVTNATRLDVEYKERGRALPAAAPAQMPADPRVARLHNCRTRRWPAGILRTRPR